MFPQATSMESARSPAALDLYCYQQARASILKQHLTNPRVIEPLAAALALQMRASLSPDEGSGPGSALDCAHEKAGRASHARFDQVSHQVFLELVQRDRTLLWLATQDMIEGVLRKKYSPATARDPATEQGERIAEVRCVALAKLGGGEKALRTFLEHPATASKAQSSFFAWLRTCVENEVNSAFRPQRTSRSFWHNSDGLDAIHSNATGLPLQDRIQDRRYESERCLQRAHRSEERRRTLAQVRLYAEENAAHDAPSRMMLAYLDWLTGRGPDQPCTQTAFAKEHGHKPGTVNACFKRFRERFSTGPLGQDLNLHDQYTTHGGSIA